MITVADILALPAFEETCLIAPCTSPGSRPVHNVGILDCPPDYNKYSVYYPGEFIVTNLGFANNDERLAEESLLAMMARNVSAIAIKTVYNPPITDAVRRASESSGVPVYLYTGAFHEMVAYQALDLIRRDEHESDHSELIDKLLESQSDEKVRRGIHDIADMTGSTMSCFAIAPKSKDESSLYAVLGTTKAFINSLRENEEEIDSVFACRYHGCVLALTSYRSSQGSALVSERLSRGVAGLGSLCCGEGREVILGCADLSIRQALACLEEARRRNVAHLAWWNLRERAFREAAHSDRMFSQTSAMYRIGLQDYDCENGTDLLETAKAFAQALGDVKDAADLLFQHPNTVRYRLRKIKALFDMENASDRELLSFLLLVFLA